MENLLYFDSHAWVGKCGYRHPLHIWKTEDILSEMERTGIAGALVYHGLAKTHSPIYGNKRLEEEIKKSDRLVGCWAVMPDHLGDFHAPAELIQQMKENQIKAAKIFPQSHHFVPDQRTLDSLLSVFEREQLPLLIDAQEISLGQLGELAAAYPNLTFLLQGLSWSQERKLFPIMDEHTNLCIELSTLQANAFIETAYNRYGAERLFFGSGMPFKSPGAARAFIDYARIPLEAKRLIAGMNLVRLLGMTPPAAHVPDQDEVTVQASQGKPIQIPVLDSHTHLIEDGGATGSGFPMIQGDIDSMIRLYRTMGIRKMSIAPWVGINGGDSEAGNLVAEKAISKYPEQVEGYVLIDPNYVEDVEKEARKWHLDKGFRGMKPYYYLSRIPYNDPIYEPWWQLGNELKLYALIDPALQSDEAYMKQIAELAERYPDVAIFMDHAARSFDIAEKYASVANKYDNVYLQLTYTTVTLGAIEYLVEKVGAEKILFGTDSPMRDPRPQLGWLAYANITLSEKKAILGENMQRIWDRCVIKK